LATFNAKHMMGLYKKYQYLILLDVQRCPKYLRGLKSSRAPKTPHVPAGPNPPKTLGRIDTREARPAHEKAHNNDVGSIGVDVITVLLCDSGGPHAVLLLFRMEESGLPYLSTIGNDRQHIMFLRTYVPSSFYGIGKQKNETQAHTHIRMCLSAY
jgi:hypothetical protein